MDMDKLIGRINELSRKNKSVGLNAEELAERDVLRKQYLEIFKGNFRNRLETIKFVDADDDQSIKH